MAEGKKDAESASPLRGSQRALEGMLVVKSGVWRRGTAACSGRMRSGNVEIEAFVD